MSPPGFLSNPWFWGFVLLELTSDKTQDVMRFFYGMDCSLGLFRSFVGFVWSFVDCVHFIFVSEGVILCVVRR